MNKIFGAIKDNLKKNYDAVLCTILECTAVASRKSGTKMAVFSEGRIVGTIGGGSLEMNAIEAAKEVLEKKRSSVKTINSCEGEVTVFIHYFDSKDENALAWIEEACRLMTDEQGWIVYLNTKNEEVKSAIYSELKGLQFDNSIPLEVFESKLGNNVFVKREEELLYTEPILHQKRVIIFGGGHVGKALVPVLTSIDFSVVIFDNRPEVAIKENYPNALDVICGDFENIENFIEINDRDYIIVMTPYHQNDYEVLRQVLHKEIPYVGCIGSRLKVAEMTECMLKYGYLEERINKIHMPIGIKMKAKTPEELAISIAAELINCRATENETK